MAGGAPMSAGIARRLIDRFQRPPRAPGRLQNLSEREEQVLHHLSDGLQYKEIADRLGISINTVGKHVGSIYGKLHVNTRAEATRQYLGQP